jgi:hypothetical protein
VEGLSTTVKFALPEAIALLQQSNPSNALKDPSAPKVLLLFLYALPVDLANPQAWNPFPNAPLRPKAFTATHPAPQPFPALAPLVFGAPKHLLHPNPLTVSSANLVPQVHIVKQHQAQHNVRQAVSTIKSAVVLLTIVSSVIQACIVLVQAILLVPVGLVQLGTFVHSAQLLLPMKFHLRGLFLLKALLRLRSALPGGILRVRVHLLVTYVQLGRIALKLACLSRLFALLARIVPKEV